MSLSFTVRRSGRNRSLPILLFAISIAAGLATATDADALNCMGDASGNPNLNCTAGDLSVASFHVTTVREACRFAGDTMTFDGEMNLQDRSTTRYDLGFYVGYDSLQAITGTCTVAILDPADIDGEGHVANADGDACGDFLHAPNDIPITNITAVCSDSNGDGKFDLAVCASYDNNAGGVCSGVASAYPATGSKCQCQQVETDLTVPRCAVNSDCVDDGNPCTNEVCNLTGGDIFGCTHPNNTAPCDDGLFCNGADVCSAGACTHAGSPCAGGATCGNVCNEADDNCFVPAGTPCRAASGVCDVAESCTGTSLACPSDTFLGVTTVCRASSGVCDATETCSGASGSCPADSPAANGTPCNDGTFCNGVDVCMAGTCTHPGNPCTGGSVCGNVCNETADNCFVAAGTPCRAASGVCDVAESCTGTSLACPSDTFLGAATVCRASSGVCDAAESCSGASGSCPADAAAADGTPCDDGTFCNGADVCTDGACTHPGDPCIGGASCGNVCNEAAGNCLVAAGTVCRASAGVCDTTEACTGAAAACPSDAFVGDGVVCRAQNGVCDVAESCSGEGPSCPADGFAPPTTTCDDNLFCNGADTCSGGTCSAHAGDPCGGAGGECSGSCDEIDDDCHLAGSAEGNPCSDDGNPCTDDVCDADGACSHPDNTAPCDDGLYCNGADTCAAGSCGHSGDPCLGGDACGNVCNEISDDCFALAGTVCRGAAGVCDAAETCTGSSDACPADSMLDAATTCRAASGICDVAETCSGASATCPADDFAADGTACDDGAFCNGTDVCAGGSCTHPGDPCAGGGDCADSCDETLDTCFDPSGTACDSDDNVCTDDACSGAGTCEHTPNSSTCDDGVFCNGNDTCAAGTCRHGGNPCSSSGVCAMTCNETTLTCADPIGTPCADDANACTDDFCDGNGRCQHDANTADCDNGLFCDGLETCVDAVCVSAGDPCAGGPTCADTCDEGADDCYLDEGLPCSGECMVQGTGICTAGSCAGDESVLSPSCHWIVIAGVGPVPAGNTVETAGVSNEPGSIIDGSACGFSSKRSRGITLGDFVMTAEQNEGLRGIGIKFAAGADVVGNIVTAGSSIKTARLGTIPGTEQTRIDFGVRLQKLDSRLLPSGTFVDTTGVQGLVDECNEDRAKLAGAIAVLDLLPATADLGRYRLRPQRTVEFVADGTTVFDATVLKIAGRSTVTLTGDSDDVIVFRSAGDIRISKTLGFWPKRF